MISSINANSLAHLQTTQSSKEKKGTVDIKEIKETDKIQAIKEQIENGKYRIDLQKTAEVVAKELI